MKADRRLGNPIASKGRYIVLSLVCFGIPLAAALVMSFGSEAGIPDSLVLIGLSLAGGVMFGVITWPYMRDANKRIGAAGRERGKER